MRQITTVPASSYVVGDIHGELDTLVRVLHAAGLIEPDHFGSGDPLWTGGPATLWFLGDFVDRGPASLEVVDLVMRLQREAPAAGGTVDALIGNHELHLLAAHHFGHTQMSLGDTFRNIWERYGGLPNELDQLTPAHIAWLEARPAMAHAGDCLLIHADALLYREYGDAVAAVNAAFARVMRGRDPAAWDQLLVHFNERRAFDDSAPGGRERARAFLARFGGRRIVHGHTPVGTMIGQPYNTVTAPLVYADGLCVNCDSGMYHGGPGFVYRVPAPAPVAASLPPAAYPPYPNVTGPTDPDFHSA
jgi:hypothetical protein